jgi:hypothetical protein
MGPSFKYAVLQATPDARRRERVNVGLVVFRPDQLDVRFGELRKLQALTGRKWEKYASEYKRRASSLFAPGTKEELLLKRLSALEVVIVPSQFGWMTASSEEEYERRVGEILSAFITKPVSSRPTKERRLNTEMTDAFRKARILGDKDDALDSHKVMRDVYLEDDIRADFVVKNGVYHVTATLDLRKQDTNIAEAALKAIVLDRAREAFGPSARKLGVYALDVLDESSFHSQIGLLRKYADETFNWSDRDERTRYQHRIFDAVSGVLPS